MRLGYFGGTFDPPHLGHLAVANAAADTFSLDRVLFIPTASQPLKANPPIASYADRLAMVALLCSEDSRFEVSDLEAPTSPPAPRYTVDTLSRLLAMEPGADLYVIVGEDAFHDLPRWHSPERLLSMADWIVVTRQHQAQKTSMALPQLSTMQREHVHLLTAFDHPASATAIRSELASRLDCEQSLSPAVRAYIRDHHLYT